MPFALLLSPAWWLAKWAGARLMGGALADKIGGTRLGSSVQAIIITVVVGAIACGLVALGVVRHDKRIATAATVACEAANRLAALEAERQAVQRALAERSRQYEAAQIKLAASEALREIIVKDMQGKLDEAARAPDAGAVVFAADDRWLQAAGRSQPATGGAKAGTGRR